MSQKKQPRLALALVIEALEIEGGHHGLASAGGGDDQIPPAVVGAPLPLQRLQNPFLKRVRGEVKKNRTAAGLFALGAGQGAAELLGRSGSNGTNSRLFQ